MDIPLIIISSLSLIVSAAALIAVLVLLKKGNNGATDERDDRQLNNLKTDILNEFSRNRTEEAARDRAQREELAQKLNETQEKLNSISERTNQSIQNISFEINRQLGHINDELSKNRQQNSDSIIKLINEMKQQLGEIRELQTQTSQAQNQKIEEALEKIRVSNEQKLDEMRNVVDEKLTNTLTQRLDSSFKTVSEQLTNLYTALGEMKEMSGGITEHVSTLNKVLTNVKARGTWAEIQLKGILDQTIPVGMYVENYAPSAKSKDRVEFAIKIPSGENNSEIIYLPIDSKFPMEDYVRLCDATERADKELIEKARAELEARVISEAKDISKYINPPKTTPFAIMYLATEGLYAEIVSSPNSIVEKLQSKYNIMIAGPTTITALLNSLSMGFKIAAINEKSSEVKGILQAIKTQYTTFGNLLAKAKKKIDEAGNTIGDAQHRSNMIQKKLKSIDAIEIKESDELLEITPENMLLEESYSDDE